MSALPRVAEHTREQICREFDDLGPAACVQGIIRNLAADNPELLDMARKCANDVGTPAQIMVGFGMFYRLLIAQATAALDPLPEARDGLRLNPLPRVTPQTRAMVVTTIDRKGAEAFTRDAIAELERNNPELLQMAHDFASRHGNYLGVMQGFALLYASLVAQSAADRVYLQ
jgi:hypothetical protein